MRLAFLASNNGSSMRRILRAIAEGELAATAVLVVSNRKAAPALDAARAAGIPALHLPTAEDPAAADSALCAALASAGADLVILSGYLRRLGPATLAAFSGRVLNVHPSLLPKFGGEGFFGRRVHEAVAAAAEPQSGVTIHAVDGEYDEGPILAQLTVPLAPGDSAEDIERKVTAAEPDFFLATLKKIASGEISLPEATVP